MNPHSKPARTSPIGQRNAVLLRDLTLCGRALNVVSVGARCAAMASKPHGVVISRPAQARLVL